MFVFPRNRFLFKQNFADLLNSVNKNSCCDFLVNFEHQKGKKVASFFFYLDRFSCRSCEKLSGKLNKKWMFKLKFSYSLLSFLIISGNCITLSSQSTVSNISNLVSSNELLHLLLQSCTVTVANEFHPTFCEQFQGVLDKVQMFQFSERTIMKLERTMMNNTFTKITTVIDSSFLLLLVTIPHFVTECLHWRPRYINHPR